MLDEQVQKAGLVVLDLRQLFQHGIGDEVASSAARGQGELLLVPEVVST